jgi:3-phenylpropionate/trans-cinnamate dioxygenase ferredoxin component
LTEFKTVADVAEIPPGTVREVNLGDDDIAIYNVEGEIFATTNVCTHDEAYLSDGELFGHVVECPLHGARFDVRTGKVLSLPAVYPLKTYEVRVEDGKVQVRV